MSFSYLNRTAITTLLAATLTAGITGCSSDGGTATTTIDGSVFASAVNGANCQIKDISGNVIVDSIITSANGNYSANIPNTSLTSDLVLICNGGTYTNESDGTSQTAGMLAAFADGSTLSTGVSLHATPESTIMHRLRTQHQMTLAEAETAFNNAFGYTPDNTIAPTDATAPGAEATDEEKLAGLRAATFSQLTLDLGLTAAQQFDLLLALADDLSDGTLNGQNTAGSVSVASSALPADIQNKFTIAMLNFRDTDNGGRDASGLSNSMIGIPPFAKIAISDSYTVEYIEGMMGAMEGKSQFQIRVTDGAGAPVSSTVSLMPMMYMDDKNHSSPVDGNCVETSTAGTYDCIMYYVMASVMMDGMSMGYWDIKVMIGGMMGESVHFFPQVMMAMNGTALVKQKNEYDTIMNMEGGADARTFLLFKSNLSGMTGNHTFELFTATMETMMSFPAVTSTTTLGIGTGNELVISSMSIEVSTDPTFVSDSVMATEDGNGYWTAAGITGLINDVEGELYVRMVINGLTYNSSIDGVYIDEATTPSYATFTVTPSMPMSM
ncbi:MAG: hypothetical protein OQK32_08960 [Gammaproteobacteria bacterium]|nr:hypothetical protein [Gammaproteobacteria bacterium]MCW8922547.1 hypothetical protein [Gammaproteobacteria bacterium]